jgi:hypothetical protein
MDFRLLFLLRALSLSGRAGHHQKPVPLDPNIRLPAMDARDHPGKPVAGRSSGRFGLQGRTFSSCTERVCEDAKLSGRRSQDAGGPREQMCMAALFKKEMRPSPRCRTTIRWHRRINRLLRRRVCGNNIGWLPEFRKSIPDGRGRDVATKRRGAGSRIADSIVSCRVVI